jgi:hypothetical protein
VSLLEVTMYLDTTALLVTISNALPYHPYEYALYKDGIKKATFDATTNSYGAKSIFIHSSTDIFGILRFDLLDPRPSPGAVYPEIVYSANTPYLPLPSTAPTAPTNVTIPTKCYQGKAVAVSYRGSSDVNGNLSGYEFQYKTNKVGWTNMTSSIVPASARGEGVTMLQVQMRAKDSGGLYSAWVPSNTCVVEPNRPPVFDGADEDLGVLREPPTVSFSVSDPDEGDAVKISVRLAGRVLKTPPAPFGDSSLGEGGAAGG